MPWDRSVHAAAGSGFLNLKNKQLFMPQTACVCAATGSGALISRALYALIKLRLFHYNPLCYQKSFAVYAPPFKGPRQHDSGDICAFAHWRLLPLHCAHFVVPPQVQALTQQRALSAVRRTMVSAGRCVCSKMHPRKLDCGLSRAGTFYALGCRRLCDFDVNYMC